MLLAGYEYVKKVKTHDVLNYLGLNFQKSLKINLGSKLKSKSAIFSTLLTP